MAGREALTNWGASGLVELPTEGLMPQKAPQPNRAAMVWEEALAVHVC